MVENTMNKMKRNGLGAACLLFVLLASAPVAAQTPEPAEPAAEETAADETAEAAEGEASSEGEVAEEEAAEGEEATEGGESDSESTDATTESAPAPPATTPDPLGGELERYWSTDRDLDSLANKLYTREGRFGVGIHVGMLSSEPFWWYLPVGGRLTYNFTDQAGVEVGGEYLLANKTDLHNYFDSRGNEAFDSDTDLEDKMIFRANATFVWSPLYGKWSFLNNKLTHFEFNLAVGAGVVGVNRPNPERTEASSAIEPELVFGPGAHFFLTENWILRADGRFYVYRGAETESSPGFFDRLQMPVEFLLGGTYQF